MILAVKLSNEMLGLVLFDMAGTTVEDPDGVGRCLKSALTKARVEWRHEQVNAVMGIPKPIAIARLMEQAGMTADPEIVTAIHHDFRNQMLDYYRHDPEVCEVDGATELFHLLRASGIKVGLDTGFDRAIVDVLLERLGWSAKHLDVTVASDEVPQGRPHPDLVYKAMLSLGISDAGRVAKVGDTPSDLQEGTAAGCGWVIGVTEGTHSRQLLEPHPHTHLINSIRDLPALFAL